MQVKLEGYGKQKKLFGDLSSLLDDLKTKAQALRRTTDFLAMKTSSSNENLLTASASSSATAGSYQVEVVSLAAAKIVSAGVNDRQEPLGSGTLLITHDGRVDAVDFGNATYGGTIDGLAAAINGGDYGVTAEVVDTGRGPGQYQLVLRGKETGVAGDFSLELDSPGNTALNTLVSDLQASQTSLATDAHVKFNGVDVYRASNSITDLIGGVTLQLKAVPATAAPVTITVSPDADATSEKVKDFVDSYNKIVDFVQSQFAVDAKGQASGLLFGDSTLRSVRSSLRSIVGSVVDTGDGAYSMFAQIGITSDTAGKLTFNQGKFEAALVSNETAVTNLFSNTQNGIANRVFEQLDTYTDSVDGLIKARTDGLNSKTKDTQNHIDQAQRRLTAFQAQLERTYANLETLMSQLKGQGSSLTSLGA
jgi:flagellar hook-associated protein 2